MPKPKYIICAETRLLDKHTGLISHINVIEVLTVTVTEQPQETGVVASLGSEWFRLVVTAIWAREPSDSIEALYEVEMLLYNPSTQEPRTISHIEIPFTAKFYRFEAEMAGPPPQISGVIMIEARMREKGTEEWSSQRYEIPVEVHDKEVAAIDHDAPTSSP